jgi:predicted metalloprotease
MRWDSEHRSDDVIDRRGEDGGRRGGGGGGIFALLYLVGPLLRTPYGWVILLIGGGIYVATQTSLFRTDPRRVHQAGTTEQTQAGDPQASLVHFVSFVLDDAQDTWTREFAARGEKYPRAKLVLFTDSTPTGCGNGRSATGPFYCPADQRVYIDLGFYRELEGKLGAQGQFAQAYVIAHEIGHHVQNVTGVSERAERGGGSSKGATGSSVRIELQADCFAGIWAHSTAQRKLLEAGDVDSAIGAATAIGDDRLQRMSTGNVSPERWTHGSSAQRVRWFKRGYESGRMTDCDTFTASSL